MNDFFKDLLVIELASVLAGPAVGMFFAELGAKVIKVENKRTNGDVTRSWKLTKEDASKATSAYYYSVNWNKEAHLMNLKEETDQQQVLSWIQEADIVISNYKAGSAKKIGMDYESLRSLNPQLIYASITSYGEDDERPGFDAMIQAETGWIYMNGEPNGNPVKMPVALMDILAAHQLKEGVLVALLKRYQTGEGSKVTVSLFDTGVSALANQASNWLNEGVIPQRKGSQHPNIAPYGDIFYSKDGKAILLSTGTEKQYQSLCKCLGLEILLQDQRFQTNALRLQYRSELIEQLAKGFQQFAASKIFELFEQWQVPAAPINNLQEVFAIPAAQDLILEEQLEGGKVSKCVRTVVFDLS